LNLIWPENLGQFFITLLLRDIFHVDMEIRSNFDQSENF